MPTGGLIINDAGATASHPYCLFLDGLDVVKQPGQTGGTAFGTNVDSVRLHEQLGEASTLEFIVDDPSKALTLAYGANVYFCDHRGRPPVDPSASTTEDLFRGIIDSFEPSFLGTSVGWKWTIRAVSLEALLDRRFLTSGVIPSGTNWIAAVQQVMSTIDERLSFLKSDAGALFVGRSVATQNLLGNGGSSITTSGAIALAGKTVRQVLTEIAAPVAAFYGQTVNQDDWVSIDAQGRLAINPLNSLAPYSTVYEGTNARDGTPYSTRAAPFDFRVQTDLSQWVNAVYIRGVDATSSGWVENTSSITSNGRREAYLDVPTATSSTLRDEAGAQYLNSHQPLRRISFGLSDTHDNLQNQSSTSSNTYGGWHVRQQLLVVSGAPNAGFVLNPGGTNTDRLTALINSLDQTWDQSVTHMTLQLGIAAGSRGAPASLFRSRLGEVADKSRAAQQLVGSLNEVAVRSKAGAPTDADFDVPRDGFIVLDTTSPGILWVRVNGTWTPMGGNNWTAYTPAVANGGTVTFTTQTGYYCRVGNMVYVTIQLFVNAAGSGAALVSIDTPSTPLRTIQQMLPSTEVNGAAPVGTGSLVTLGGGSGATWERLRLPTNNANNQDNNITGADLLAGMIINVQGWYREA